jgi:hypothetical protein
MSDSCDQLLRLVHGYRWVRFLQLKVNLQFAQFQLILYYSSLILVQEVLTILEPYAKMLLDTPSHHRIEW